MRITAFGASTGPGPLHCTVLEIDDGRIVGRESRTIDPGALRRGRGNLLSSGYDLLVRRAEHPVDAASVAVDTRRDLLSIRCGVRGGARSASVVRARAAVLRALDEEGVTARFSSALVVDVGPHGVRTFSADGAPLASRRGTPDVGAVVSAALDRAEPAADGIVVVGAYAARPQTIAAIDAAAGDIETVLVDEPEAVAATGAALLAADGYAAGTAPSTLVGGAAGTLTGRTVGLTAAVFPVLALAALGGALLVTGYSTGLIGPAGESTHQVVPTTSTLPGDAVVLTTVPTATVVTTVPTRPTTPEPVPTWTGDVVRPDGSTVPPTMTTFAPPPAAPTAAPTWPSGTAHPSPAPSRPLTGTHPAPGTPTPETPARPIPPRHPPARPRKA